MADHKHHVKTEHKEEEEKKQVIDWREDLEQQAIDEEAWTCHISWVVETSVDDQQYLQLLNEAVTGGARKCLKSITYNGLLSTIKIFANDLKAGRKSAGLPETLESYTAACAEAMTYSGKGGTFAIPNDLLAKLIKFEVLRLKHEWILITEREVILKQEIASEFDAMMKAKVCVAGAGKNAAVVDKRSSKKSLSIKSTKTNTKLHKRGEEWKDIKFIEDSPKEGPQLYVVLSGFYDVDLLLTVLNSDMPLISIVQIDTGMNLRSGHSSPTSLDLQDLTKTARDATVKENEVNNIYDQFWSSLSANLNDLEKNKPFENVAFITYCPSQAETPTENNPAGENIESEHKKLIFDQISFLMYDVQDMSRQHINYLRHMRVKNICDESPIVKIEEFDVYNRIMDSIPSECVTVPVIVHSLLEEVCSRVRNNSSDEVCDGTTDVVSKGKEETDRKSDSVGARCKTQSKNDQSKVKAIDPPLPVPNKVSDEAPRSQTFKKYEPSGYHKKMLKLFENAQKKFVTRRTLVDEVETIPPRVVSYGNVAELLRYGDYDEVVITPKEDDRLDVVDISVTILQTALGQHIWNGIWPPQWANPLGRIHYNKLVNAPSFDSTDEMKKYSIALKLIENLQCQDSKESPLVSACEYLKYRSAKYAVIGNDPKKLIVRSEHKEVKKREVGIDSNDLIVCPEIVCLDDTDARCTCGDFDMQEFNVVEKYSKSSLLQILFQISNMCECIDYYYYRPGDFLILICHDDNASTFGVTVTDWVAKITTPVCLRDFVNYILNEEPDWIDAQDVIFEQTCRQEDDTMKKLMHINSKLSPDDSLTGIESAADAAFTITDYLVPGSIKIKKYLHLFQEPQSKNKSLGRKETGSVNLKGPMSNGSVRLPENSVYRRLSCRTATEDEPFDFIGYDLASYRVHVNGTTTDIQSKDGTRIIVERSGWCFTANTLSVKLTKSKHKMYLYSVAEMPPKPFRPFGFHIEASNGVIIAFSKTEVAHRKSTDVQEDGLIPQPICFIGRSIPFRSKESFIETEEEMSLNSQENVSLNYEKESVSHVASTRKHTDEKKRRSMNATVPDKTYARIESEKKNTGHLTPKHSMTQSLLKTSNYLCTRSQILNMLKEAKTKSFPCYKIISSKLHTYKYLKRIKPRVSICIGNLIRRLTVKPASTKRQLSKRSLRSQEYKFKTTPSALPCQSMNFSFKASCPSGLMVETVPSVFDYDPFYVRQYYISKGPACKPIATEIKRCFLRNGTVLIFKKNSRLDILCADSSIYVCQIGASVPRTSVSSDSRNSGGENRRPKMKTNKFRSIAPNRNNKVISGSVSLTCAVSRNLYRKQLKHSFAIAKDQFKQNPCLVPIPEYTLVTSTGTKCKIRRNRIASFPSKYIVQSATDYFEGETFTERQDGTHSLLNSEGVLATSFPDGSRITSGFVVDEDELFCEFSEDEINTLIVKHFKIQPEEISCIDEETMLEFITFDGFVSIRMSCSFEHPNYGIVSYDGLQKSVQITLPDGIEIESTRDGDFSGCLDHRTEFSVDCDEIVFKKRLCKYSSTSIVNISPLVSYGSDQDAGSGNRSASDHLEDDANELKNRDPSVYITNVDMFNQRVNISYSGDVTVSEPVDVTNVAAMKKRKCMIKQLEHRKNYFFLMERDLTGVQFLTQSEIDRIRNDTHKSECESLAERNDITVLKDIDDNCSNRWLVPYKKPKIMPKYLTRTDMKPSTYFPESWLSPVSRRTTIEKRSLSLNFGQTKIPDKKGAILKRTFLKLCDSDVPSTLCASASIKAYLRSVDDERQDINTPKYLDEHTVIKDECSALTFKEKWYLRELECERFRRMLRNFSVPHYYSEQMEEMMFDKKNPRDNVNVKEKIKAFVLSKMQKDNEKNAIELDETRAGTGPYQPDLQYLTEQWEKFRADRKNPPKSEKRKSEAKPVVKPTMHLVESDTAFGQQQDDGYCNCKCVPEEETAGAVRMVPVNKYSKKKRLITFGERPRVRQMVLQGLENQNTDVVSCTLSECQYVENEND